MPRSQQKLVLVVDDSPDIIDVFERAFRGQEDLLILDVAVTLRMALRKVEVMLYDLIFLDMKIDGNSMAGMELLSMLRRQEIKLAAQGIPFLPTMVIIMSGSMMLNDITQEAHGLDVFHFIDKPNPFTKEFVQRVVSRFGLPLLPNRTRP